MLKTATSYILLGFFMLLFSQPIKGNPDQTGENASTASPNKDNNHTKLLADLLEKLDKLEEPLKDAEAEQDRIRQLTDKRQNVLSNRATRLDILKRKSDDNTEQLKDQTKQLTKSRKLLEEIEKMLRNMPPSNSPSSDKEQKADEAIEKIMKKFKELLDKPPEMWMPEPPMPMPMPRPPMSGLPMSGPPMSGPPMPIPGPSMLMPEPPMVIPGPSNLMAGPPNVPIYDPVRVIPARQVKPRVLHPIEIRPIR